jgi:hypothetical protein
MKRPHRIVLRIVPDKGASRHARRLARRRPAVAGRGVASVLAMMFVVLFGSLAVAMAIVSKGNLRTAHTHMHVVRAMGAADTGLAVAQARLAEAASRFVISKGQIDSGMGGRLWNGTLTSGDGTVIILPPRTGYPESGQPSGVIDALVNVFSADVNLVAVPGIPDTPTIHAAPSGTDLTVFAADGWLTCPPVAIDVRADTNANAATFQVTYAPLANGTDVRIIVTGYSSVNSLGGSGYHYGGADSANNTRPLTRVVQQDFRIVKRHQHAMLSPSRIMLGKNVYVEGNVGSLYEDVAQNNGHPLTVRSDFLGINAALDAKLTAFYNNLAQYDVDGDNRLRSGHAVEGDGVPSNSTDYDGDGQPDAAFDDATGDGYVDDFDIFIKHYDSSGDGKVTLAPTLTADTPAQGQPAEFTADNDLALLIDTRNPDRNGNGVYGSNDPNRNGRWDPGETLLDYDSEHGVYPDQMLGYRDGYIDRKDQYAKVRGRMMFTSNQSAWTAAQGDYQQYVRGAVRPPDGESAVRFDGTSAELPLITASSFTDTETPLHDAADGASFDEQVAAQLGIAPSSLNTYTETSTSSTDIRYFRADMNDATVFSMTGRHLYERMPFNAPVQAYADYYYRPRYENMVFKDVQIPRGNNGLFINCTFVGVTWVHSYADNTHDNWPLYGRMEWNETLGYPTEITDPLDKSDFARYTTGNPIDGPENYDDFPDPPVIDGVLRLGAERNTKLYSNNIRFHDSLFVGTIVSDTPQEYTHVRNKFQFTGATRFVSQHPDEPTNPDLNPDPDDVDEIAKSSMMVPNYSVDIGQFNSPTDTFSGGPTAQNVDLHGTVVAGVLDARGNTNIEGTLLLTFAPIAGQGPLEQHGQPVGNPASFNATLGYFGPEDGDGESVSPSSLPVVGGQRIVGYDTDGDGIADVAHDQPQPPGSTPVPFYGYGRVVVEWNPDLPMPDGILLPASIVPLQLTYREGRQ